MNRFIVFVALCFSASVGGSAQAEEHSQFQPIEFSVEVKGQHEDGHFSQSSRYIKTRPDSSPVRISFRTGYLEIDIVDERNGEYSIRLDLCTVDGAVVDSTNILTSSLAASFEFPWYNGPLTGNIAIERTD